MHAANRTPLDRITDLAAVAAGGAVGTGLRALGLVLFSPMPDSVPWVVAAANIAGAFAMGLLAVRWLHPPNASPRLRLFLLTGLLGSFTTFSALAVDLAVLSSEGPTAGAAAIYLVVSIGGGLLAASVGLAKGNTLASVDSVREVAR